MGYSPQDYLSGDVCLDEFMGSKITEGRYYDRDEFEALVEGTDEDSS
jgi:hypothetical protein